MTDAIDFHHFDSLNLATDHHYINSKKSCNNVNNKAIMKEWRILQNNLPDSIYVQVYETQIDLLRAAIVGPPGTPYHDGLFFFDILFPSNYPNEPPKVHYHSRGHKLNPNLYADGFVCLSLINTWLGSKTERWTIGSTILQLLVSIQGLVLNARPFFNEAGFKRAKNSKLSMWRNISDRYNEQAFILSCSTMLHIIRRPPEGFEGFVVEHFRRRGESLLAAILHYQEGLMLVGQFEMNSAPSSKFKSNLERVYLELYRALDPIVPSLHDTVAKTMIEVRRGRDAGKKAKNHKKGLLGKITSFAKKIWHS